MSSLSPQALAVGPAFTQTSRAGVVSTSLLSLTCSTCPLAPASAGLNARVCLAQRPEPQSRSSCPVRVRLPEPGRGACHQESSPQGDPPHSAREHHGVSQHAASSSQPPCLLLRILDICGIPGLSQTGRMSGAKRDSSLGNPRESGQLPCPLASASASKSPTTQNMPATMDFI